jgi:hypothetical protein
LNRLPRKTRLDPLKMARQHERWLGERGCLVRTDLDLRAALMRRQPLDFMQGGLYMFAARWPQLPAMLVGAPSTVVAGDAHPHNFGTWLDAEGRLCFGLFDLDEASCAPYTADLVRLTAGILCINDDDSIADPQAPTDQEVVQRVLAAYREALERGGHPLVLEENELPLRALVGALPAEPNRYWAKIHDLRPLSDAQRRHVPDRLSALLPKGASGLRVVRWADGVAGLGCQRFALIGQLDGAYLGREARQLGASTWHWLAADRDRGHQARRLLVESSRRPVEPMLRYGRTWRFRRLSPASQRLEIARLTRTHSHQPLHEAMAQELANLHLAMPKRIKGVLSHLRNLPQAMLLDAARQVVEWNFSDFTNAQAPAQVPDESA